MPYTSMPAWPNFSDEDVSDLAYFVTTFSPDFSNKERVPQAVQLPSAPGATKESAEQGKKIFADTGCVKCHGTLGRGDGPSAPTLMDDWNHPIRAADLSQSWTFRGGSSREDIFRTMSTGLNGTPMPSFSDSLTPEQRWAITDYIVSLSGTSGPGYTNVVDRQARRGSDRPRQRRGELRLRACRSLSNHRADHGTRARVPSAGDERRRSGDLRRRLHRRPRSVARQDRGEGRDQRPVAAGASGRGRGGGAGGPGRRRAGRRESVRRRGSSAGAQAGNRRPRQIPSRRKRAPAPKASEFSDAVAVQIPSQTPTGPRKPYFIFGDGQSSVDLWFFDLARPNPQQFTGKGSGDIAPNDTGDVTGVASYDQGEWSVIFKRPLRPIVRRAVYSGRVLCPSRSPSGTDSRASEATGEVSPSGTRSTSSLKTSPRPLAR